MRCVLLIVAVFGTASYRLCAAQPDVAKENAQCTELIFTPGATAHCYPEAEQRERFQRYKHEAFLYMKHAERNPQDTQVVSLMAKSRFCFLQAAAVLFAPLYPIACQQRAKLALRSHDYSDDTPIALCISNEQDLYAQLITQYHPLHSQRVTARQILLKAPQESTNIADGPLSLLSHSLLRTQAVLCHELGHYIHDHSYQETRYKRRMNGIIHSVAGGLTTAYGACYFPLLTAYGVPQVACFIAVLPLWIVFREGLKKMRSLLVARYNRQQEFEADAATRYFGEQVFQDMIFWNACDLLYDSLITASKRRRIARSPWNRERIRFVLQGLSLSNLWDDHPSAQERVQALVSRDLTSMRYQDHAQYKNNLKEKVIALVRTLEERGVSVPYLADSECITVLLESCKSLYNLIDNTTPHRPKKYCAIL